MVKFEIRTTLLYLVGINPVGVAVWKLLDGTRNLEQIIAATDRGATLVRQLLAFSRRAVLQPEVIELDEENYYFRLKDHQQWLIDYIEQNPTFVAPTAPVPLVCP